MSSSSLVIIVSYEGREGSFRINVGPSLELADDEIERASEELWESIRASFRLSPETRIALHEAETGRIMSKETLRDPSCIPSFPKYWYLTVDNGYTRPATANKSNSLITALSGEEENYSSVDVCDLNDLLLMKEYSTAFALDGNDFDIEDDDEEVEEDDNSLSLYPSLMELSMGRSPSPDSSREDLTTMSLTCNEEGEFGFVLRHFTVIANVPRSENSGSEDSSQNDSRSASRSSTHSSSDLYDTLRMSTLFVQSVVPGGPAEQAGLQTGDILYSINGQVVSGCATEDVMGILSKSGPRLTLCATPEQNDDLLFLYPQYVQGEPGEFTRASSEKILVTDLVAKVTQLYPQNEEEEQEEEEEEDMVNSHLKPTFPSRPISADETLIHRITTELDSYLKDNSSPLPSRPRPTNHSSNNSFGSEYYSSSNDDLLISGSLADIPVVPSPLRQRKIYTRNGEGSGTVFSNNFVDGSPQEWLSQEEERGGEEEEEVVEWFPGAAGTEEEDVKGFTYSLPVGMNKTSDPSSSSVMSQSGEYVPVPVRSNSPSKFARRIKQTIRNLTGTSSSSSHRKLTKTSSLGVVQTCSTSALDRLKVKNPSLTSNQSIGQRSRSTDLGRIKIKGSSLEALTKVSSSVENLTLAERQRLQKHHYTDHPIPPSLAQLHYTVVQQQQPTRSSSLPQSSADSDPSQLSPSNNLSGESNGGTAGRGARTAGGRSYRNQRERLHQTRSRGGLEEKDVPPITQGSNPPTRRVSRETAPASSEGLSFSKMGAERRHQRTTSTSTQLTDESADAVTLRGHSQESYVLNSGGVGGVINKSPVFSERRKGLVFTNESIDDRVSVSPCGDESRRFDEAGHRSQSFTGSVDLSATGSSYHQGKLLSTQSRPRADRGVGGVGGVGGGGGVRGKIPARKTYSFDERKQVGKINSVFHGPIQKKQERGQGGRKPSERSWKSIYAAIQGHWMVFYGTVQDALTGQPLPNEPSLDLRQCIVTVLPRKKHVFRLTFINGCECLIQAENEEAMMRWMRIIHNLNRHIQRLGPLPLHHLHRTSTQEEPKTKKEKIKTQRAKTPQPPKKPDKDKRSREVLLERLKRTLNPARKESDADSVDAVFCNTFGLPIDECPFSDDNKYVPLVMTVCLTELESKWLDTEGLYRLAGPIGQVRVLAEELNKGRFDLLRDQSDPHVLTGILKKFLKELPNPLVPNGQYGVFISAAREPDIELREEKLKELIKNLPLLHYYTLGYLVRHLNRVEAHSNVNKMALRNLCLVFGPTIVRKASSEENNTLVADMNHTYTVVELLMKKVDELFTPIPLDSTDGPAAVSGVRSEGRGGSDMSFNSQPDSKSSIILKRGLSDTVFTNKGTSAVTRVPRRSYDESNTRIGSIYSQEHHGGLSVDEYWFSQDSRTNRPHKKRLAKSRLFLTSTNEDTVPTPLDRPTHSSPHLHRQPNKKLLQRKISYNYAVEDSSLLPTPVSSVGLLDDEPFSHQGLYDNSTGQQVSTTSPHHRSYHQTRTKVPSQSTLRPPVGRPLVQSEVHRRHRYSINDNRVPSTEIVGPSSGGHWSNAPLAVGKTPRRSVPESTL